MAQTIVIFVKKTLMLGLLSLMKSFLLAINASQRTLDANVVWLRLLRIQENRLHV